MPPMKNVYNLITDAFARLGNGAHREENYIITVSFTETNVRIYDIKIKSKNPNSIGSANLILTLNLNNHLIDYDDTNDLFMNNIWDRFCITFEEQISLGNTLQQYIMQYANTNQPVEEDPYEV
jgi:hypothetical protein